MAKALQPRTATTPAPISIAPSQVFEGNDGPWSTFVIRVGTPDQDFHVLISTAGQETWVPVPEGCTSTDPSDCGALRGVEPFDGEPSTGFQVNSSSTWIPINLYSLGLDSNLNYTGNGEYGFDTVGLELPNSGGPTLPHQIVAGIADKSFMLGIFALGPKPTNFSTFDNPQPSYMWSLKNQSLIPSISWGYTAGAPYRLKQVPGSLTLGEYDASRFTANNLTFPFGPDDSKPLTVGLQVIQATNTFLGSLVSLLHPGILTVIDSTVPEIWLPEETCDLFESAFGLHFDEHTDRYLVNDSVHSSLLTMNPVLTFTLGNSIEQGPSNESISISLPYAAFDLQASYPIYKNAANYFPLRRAVNESQYTIGRVFLQEAYVITDYERSNFSISQCVFEENNPEHVVAIQPPTTGSGSSSSGLGTDNIIAIFVSIVTAALLIATGTFLFVRLRRKRREQRNQRDQREAELAASNFNDMESPQELEYKEKEGQRIHEVGVGETRQEMMGDDRDMRHESGGVERLSELSAVAYERHVHQWKWELHTPQEDESVSPDLRG